MTTITWLHLSDLHCRSDKAGEKFRSGVVLTSLWSDIVHQIADGLRPDFAVVTGDIAYHGKSDEYSVAKESFFEPLLQATSLPKDRLFVVPGNHDVDWALIDDVMADGMHGLLTDSDRINQFLEPTRDRGSGFPQVRCVCGIPELLFWRRAEFRRRAILLQPCHRSAGAPSSHSGA